MSDCKKQQCCDVAPFSGECCQPQTFQSGYPNDEQCFVATCPSGSVGTPVKVCVPRGTIFKPTLEEANELALSQATIKAQSQIVCSTLYFNTAQTATANCPIGETGSATRTVNAGQYTSTISQTDANNKAYAAALVAATNALVCTEDPCRPFSTNITVTLTDPCALSANGHAFYVLYSGGTSMAPGSTAIYATQAACEAANAGAQTTFIHSGGTIGMFLNDDPYGDNIAGSPTPGFQLTGPGGTSATVRPDIFSNAVSLQYTYGPYFHENLTASYDLSTVFPYAQMWDGACPIGCRNNPRAHTGSITFGPYGFDVEIFAITPLVFADDYDFTGGSQQGNCGGPPIQICASTVLKTLTAGNTTTLHVYDTDGAHCFAVGWIGVRPTGAMTECDTEPTGEVCGCGTGTFDDLASAMQERYRQGNGWSADPLSSDGSWITWPAIVVGGNPVSAEKYPPAGFYESDDTWGVAARKASLLQSIHDAFMSSGLFTDVRTGKYTPRLSLEGFLPTNTGAIPVFTNITANNIPRYQTSDVNGTMFASSIYEQDFPETYLAPLTINAGNVTASLQTLREYVCKLNHIVLELDLPSEVNTGAIISGGHALTQFSHARNGSVGWPDYPAPTKPETESSVKSDYVAAWQSGNPPFPPTSGAWPECIAWCSFGFCFEPQYNIGFSIYRAQFSATLSGFTIGKGLITVYAALGVHSSQGEITVFSHTSSAPQNAALDSKFYPLTAKTPDGTDYASPIYANESPNWQNVCGVPGFNNNVDCYLDAYNLAMEGWAMKGAVVGIFKDSAPSKGAWTYYP